MLAECGGGGRLGRVLAECGGGGRLGKLLAEYCGGGLGGCCGDGSWGEVGGVGWSVVGRGRLISVRADISFVGGRVGLSGIEASMVDSCDGGVGGVGVDWKWWGVGWRPGLRMWSILRE